MTLDVFRHVSALRRSGVTIWRQIAQTLAAEIRDAQMPTEETAHLLKQPVTRPLLCVCSVDVDPHRQRIKYGETLFSGERVQLTIAMEDTP